MDKIDFPTFLESAGKEFQARIERAHFYQHPSGIGDAREDAVRQYLQEILSPRFCVDRGKIFDSEGHLSREFDVIVSEANDIAPAMALAGRRIVPVEAVYGVIEVKSSLKQEAYKNFISAVRELDLMKRLYHPLHPLMEADHKAQEKRTGKIWSGIVAFEAPAGKTFSEYLTECCEGFWFICVPGKELVIKRSSPFGFVGVPYQAVEKRPWVSGIIPGGIFFGSISIRFLLQGSFKTCFSTVWRSLLSPWGRPGAMGRTSRMVIREPSRCFAS